MNPDSAVVPHQSPVCSELQRLTLGYYLAEHPLLLSKIMVARILHPHDSPLYFHSFSIMPERPKKNCEYLKVSKGAKIRNRYNQVPHLTQDTNGYHLSKLISYLSTKTYVMSTQKNRLKLLYGVQNDLSKNNNNNKQAHF